MVLPGFGLSAVALACAVMFIRQERRASEPLLDLKLFENGSFVAAVIAAGMMTFAMQGAMVFLPLYFPGSSGHDTHTFGVHVDRSDSGHDT